MALSVQDFYRSSNGNRWQLVRDQGALSWELRAATSLALLLRDQGRFGPGPTPTSAGLAMVFKLVEAAQKSWRRIDGHNQLPKLIQGVKFADGIEVIGHRYQDLCRYALKPFGWLRDAKKPKIAVISPRWRGRIEGFARAIGVGRNAMGVAGHKTYWNLLETLYWIYSRDNRGLVTTEEQNRIALAMSSANAVSDLYSLLLIAECDLQADFERPAGQGDRKSPDIDDSGMIARGEALNYLLEQVRSRRVRMTAMQCTSYRVRQVSLPLAELYDLEFRITQGARIATVGLWSRSRNTLMWRSPQFLRIDVVRAWPTRKKKTAAVSGVILRHLQAITNSAAPLTRAEAQRRCLADVPNAYAAAFGKAWTVLDASCKRGRGKHGSRAHHQAACGVNVLIQ